MNDELDKFANGEHQFHCIGFIEGQLCCLQLPEVQAFLARRERDAVRGALKSLLDDTTGMYRYHNEDSGAMDDEIKRRIEQLNTPEDSKINEGRNGKRPQS